MQVETKDRHKADIEAITTGDVAAFERVYRALAPKLYTFAYKLVQSREEAEEIVQDVFVKIWDRRAALDPFQNLDGYLFKVAKNLVYNKIRHRVYETAFSQYLATYGAVAENTTQTALEHQELMQLFEEACASMPPVRRQVFTMSRTEGLSNTEIAAALNTSNSNIENHLNKALKMLREKFKNYDIVYLFLLAYAYLLR
ncbi:MULTISPECIES: RNA polymerase sigma-70 factor [Rufibacter]|uniref:RNA polymerase sigma-70 factor (ECF subfamily) n=1 Tax=Rufibacter quisquiliarum TaxID=1549639 RepID=A0A839GRS1_9BACT|nr:MULTISPECIES: RNA polymerase sigma-70 factor [Rufibacter]MBA9077536.1 RNA polymerase sigma-70 factor (ECF subfamily) [Rufibacter quisquiliarum]